ncbi:YeiH family putative sulfate export transporter [Bradyrhizobium sp. 83012]|uniref:YeiH family putative sulfate export transporter n=1 Tax=Bradyrhizobium aeschynomenes TaxID=2734909 RepID=A0ABX2CID9_9BRAD|nr:YeiH family protein [Bradyrhizobium aeschynomenes]NPU67961.1 YeiH family putative sulfate export transporter [Bradyrhizobium aeschynomenes]
MTAPSHDLTADAPIATHSGHARASATPRLPGLLPGLALSAAIAAGAFGLRLLPGLGMFSPMILAIVAGMALHNVVGTPTRAKPGVAFAMRRVLRFAIILLGMQLTAAQIVEVGARGLFVIALSLTGTFLFTVWIGRLLGVDRKLAELIAAGTSICGASAVIATNTVTRAHDEDVAYAVACVTVFGSVAMVAYPLLPGLLHLDAHAFGLWSGASIHEIAQVVAAAFQGGQQAGEFGTIAKLARVMLLAPVVLTLGLLAARRARHGGHGQTGAQPPLPWFVFGFIALVGLNSLITVPAEVKTVIVTATTFLLSMALAAMGLETDFAKLKAKGLRPLALGFAAFLFIAGFSLALVKLTT